MKSAITVSLVPQAKGGPFVFWDGIEDAIKRASSLGFSGIEIFPTDAQALNVQNILSLCSQYNVKVAAIGTGAGWVIHKWHLCHPDVAIRQKALHYISEIIDIASQLDAPAIIGSMQGRIESDISREQALSWLSESLRKLSALAFQKNQPLIYEPLNRYETNLFNRLADADYFLTLKNLDNVKLLADLFHMNIEEESISHTISSVASRIGHIHFADSNRRAIGLGHTEIPAVVRALKDIGFQGYLSAEIVPLPDSELAASQAAKAFQYYAS